MIKLQQIRLKTVSDVRGNKQNINPVKLFHNNFIFWDYVLKIQHPSYTLVELRTTRLQAFFKRFIVSSDVDARTVFFLVVDSVTALAWQQSYILRRSSHITGKSCDGVRHSCRIPCTRLYDCQPPFLGQLSLTQIEDVHVFSPLYKQHSLY